MRFVLLLAVQLFAGVASADLTQLFVPIVETQSTASWKMAAGTDPLLNSAACLAQTSKAKSALPVEMVVSIPKDVNLLPLVYVRITGLARNARQALIKFGAKEFQPMFLYQEAATNSDPDIYWYAPRDLSRLIAMIKGNNTIDIAFDVQSGTPVPVQFSLAGSTNAVNQAVACAKYNLTAADTFLKFLNEKIEVTPPATGASIPEIQALTQKAFGEYLKGRKTADALVALRKAMKPLTDKESAASKDFNSKHAEVEKLTLQLTATEADILKMEKEVTEMSAALPLLESQLITAKGDLVAKKAPYDQGKAQLVNVEKLVASKLSDLKKANEAVARAEKLIVDNTASIKSLQARNRSLQARVGQINGELPGARRAADAAAAEYNNFDERREREDYLRSRTWYDSWLRDVDSKRRDLESAERDLQSAQNDVQTARSALDNCRRTAGADCRSEEGRLHSAESNVWSYDNRVRSLDSDIRDLESRIRSAEDEADRHARGITDELYAKSHNANRYYQGLIDERSNAQAEVKNNETKKIPALEASIQKATQDLPGLRTAIVAAQASVDDANKVYAIERAKIGFDAVEKGYLSALELVRQLSETISTYKTTVAKNKTQLPKSKAAVAKLKTSLAKAVPARDLAQTKLTGIQTQLGPQRQQEAALMKEVEASKTVLVSYRGIYLGEIAKHQE